MCSTYYLMLFRQFLIWLIFSCFHVFAIQLSPENGAQLNYIHILFEWEQTPQTSIYQIQVSESDNFSNPIVDVIDSTLCFIETESIDWDKSYYWRIRSQDLSGNWDNWTSPFTFSTGLALSSTVSTTSIPNEVQDGITVFGAFFNYFSAAVDETGKEVWNSGEENLVYYSTSQYGDVFGCTLVSGTENNLPGKEFTFDGETIWEEPNDEFLHHDIIQLPNGNYLGIVEDHSLGPIPIGEWTPLFQGLGFQADGVTIEFPWVGDKLVEWDAHSGDVVWAWSVFDHFSMLDYDQYGGTWNQAYVDLHYDWTHVNAVTFDEVENAIYISTRHLSRITKIDYSSGDVIWNLGHNMPSGQVTIGHDIGFSFQHSIQILDNGNLLTFDNGNLSEIFRGTDEPQSRAIEIAINENNAALVWSYELSDDLFGFASGNAQKLENGNVLLTTVGGGGRSLEVNTNGNIVWEANYNLSLPNGAVYRAHRIPSLFPATFSVIVDNLNEFGDNVGVNLNPGAPSVSYHIVNEGNYELTLQYSFTDQLGWFEPSEGMITLSPNSEETISFVGNIPTNTTDVSQLDLIVTPIHHPEKQKQIQTLGVPSSLGIYVDQNIPEFVLLSPYPNPFNNKVTISYDNYSIEDRIKIDIYDISGKLVKSLMNKHQNFGRNTFEWDARNQSSGVYFVRYNNGIKSQTKKIILIK